MMVAMAFPVLSVRLRKVNLKAELLTDTSGFLSPKTSINKNSSSFNPDMTLIKPLMSILCPFISQLNFVVFNNDKNEK